VDKTLAHSVARPRTTAQGRLPRPSAGRGVPPYRAMTPVPAGTARRTPSRDNQDHICPAGDDQESDRSQRAVRSGPPQCREYGGPYRGRPRKSAHASTASRPSGNHNGRL